jgi:hypothetical protein
VGAGEIQFEGIYPGILAAPDQLAPCVLVVFLHDRGDEYPLRAHVLRVHEFTQSHLELQVTDQVDVFPADDLLPVVRHQLPVARGDIDDLGAPRLAVFAITPPKPSLKARLMTFTIVPGGTNPIAKAVVIFNPSTVVASLLISLLRIA